MSDLFREPFYSVVPAVDGLDVLYHLDHLEVAARVVPVVVRRQNRSQGNAFILEMREYKSVFIKQCLKFE
jgi:hypothetical protein